MTGQTDASQTCNYLTIRELRETYFTWMKTAQFCVTLKGHEYLFSTLSNTVRHKRTLNRALAKQAKTAGVDSLVEIKNPPKTGTHGEG
jgi:hypothetical protein